MWPKMLFEVLPHVGRLVPMAEKFFQTRGAREAEEQASLNAMTETLRTELGHLTESQAGIQQTLAAQREQATATATEVARIRAGVDSLETRLTRLEGGFTSALDAANRADQSATRAARLFLVVVGLLVLVAAMLAFLIVHVVQVH